MKELFEEVFPDSNMPWNINRATVLSTIIEKGPISRVDIARLSGLDQSTVSRIMTKLIESGIVLEENKGKSALGRKPINVKLNARSRVVGVIVVNPWQTEIAVIDLNGNLIKTKRLSTIVEDPQNFLAACSSALQVMLDTIAIPLAGMTVTLPGWVDQLRGVLIESPYLGWKNVEVAKIVSKKIQSKIFVENDQRSSALAQICFSPEAMGLKSFFLVQIDVGVWGALGCHNTVYHGAQGRDCQIGSLLVPLAADLQTAGLPAVGELENMASERFIVNRYCELSGKPLQENTDFQIRGIICEASKGDRSAVQAIEEAAFHLGSTLPEVDRMFDTEKIIIAGKLTRVWDIVLPAMLKGSRHSSVHKERQLEKRIIPSSLVWPPYEGAAAIVIKDFLGGFQVVHRQPTVTDWQMQIWEDWEKYAS
ncbi:ROK family protein [bacterium]|nr:ROK family protein [bacterium]